MIIRYGQNEHGAIDSDIIVHIARPSKCTLIYDNLGNTHSWENTEFEHEYIMKKWIDSKKIQTLEKEDEENDKK